MKLSQITEGQLPPGTLRYFQKNSVDYDVNADGSIDMGYNFEVTSSLPLDFPKINHVDGDFQMRTHDGKPWISVMPNTVAGNCTIEVGDSYVVKTSELPRSSNGEGNILIKGECRLQVDDDTLSTYKFMKLDGPWIFQGLEHLPRNINTPVLRIEGSPEGIPPSITTIAIIFKTHDGNDLKGIHKRIQKFNVGSVLLFVPYDTPLLGFFKMRTSSLTVLHININNGFYTDVQVLDLGNILNRGIKQDKTVFEVQEDLIEAGFARNAKL